MSIGESMKIRPYRLIVIMSGVVFFSSCAHLPEAQRDIPVVIPEGYAFETEGDAYPDRWWTVFEDEQLEKLVTEALGGNFGLKQARYRLEQANAIALKAGAEQIPDVSIGGNAARLRSLQVDPTGAKSVRSTDHFGLNLAASYEIDLWGRIGATKRAAVLDAQTAHDILDTAAMTLVAQTTDTWYQIAAFQERLSLLKSQVKSNEDQLRLQELRFNNGQTTALDVLRQREQLAALRTLLPRLEAILQTMRHQLAVLLGRAPQITEDLVPSLWPALPPLPDVGVPAGLLQKRPDVRAALRAVRAADERVAAAIAARLPALRLTASADYSASDAGDLFNDWFWNIAGSILAPVLDGGRLRAEVKRSHAAASEQLARCGEVILNAMREVESALVNESRQAETIARQVEQQKAASQALQHVRARYSRGLSDYLPVLIAMEREQSVTRALVETRRELLSYRIQLYRSLGGEWMRSDLGFATSQEGEKEND